MGQLAQLVGALLVLFPFALATIGRLDPRAYGFLLPNLAGAVVLAVDAWAERQIGFLLLEAVWALVSAWGVAERLRGREPAALH